MFPPEFTGTLYGYGRVSTEDQNLDLQIDALRKAGVPDKNIFTEKRSGKNMDRPKFRKMMRMIRPGDCVVIWKLDRLGRTMLGVLQTVEEMEKQRVHFRVIRDNIDTTTPMGRLILHLFAAIAQLERDLISERTKAGMEAARAKGAVFGRGHYILNYPKRLARFEELWKSGELQKMRAMDIIEEMHRVDPKAPKYGSTQSYINWKSKGFPGFDKPEE